MASPANEVPMQSMSTRRPHVGDRLESTSEVRPLIREEQYHHDSHNATSSPVGSLLKSAKEESRPLRSTRRHFFHQQSLFINLTAIALMMVTINVVEAILIDSIGRSGHALAIMLALPACVMAIMLAILAWRTAVKYRELAEAWREASASKRLAWVGVILTVIVPIIICQFIYMPLVARHEWKRVSWTTELRVPEIERFPGITAQFGSTNKSSGLNIVDARARWENSDEAPGFFDLSQRNATINPHVAFTPTNSNGTEAAPVNHGRLNFNFALTFNSDINPVSGMSFILYDAGYSFNDPRAPLHCGSPAYQYLISPPVTTRSIINLQTTAYQWDDVRALGFRDYNDSCPPQLSSYSYYTGTADSAYLGVPLENSHCDVGGNNYTGANCSFSMFISQSNVITTQKSSHGTNALKILTDEGGILGGILFVTWFFGIFELFD
ncbi:hypothetical protein LTR95_016614 [Oleoguttula sp. CCFEE 5521]